MLKLLWPIVATLFILPEKNKYLKLPSIGHIRRVHKMLIWNSAEQQIMKLENVIYWLLQSKILTNLFSKIVQSANTYLYEKNMSVRTLSRH